MSTHSQSTDPDDVVVVPARDAYPEYLAHAAYVCQPGRAFRDGITHMAFYTRTDRAAPAAIQVEVPEILRRADHVAFTGDEVNRLRRGDELDKRIAALIETLAAAGPREWGTSYQVFLLTGPDDTRTVKLDEPIVNSKVDQAGNPVAWVRNQRYLSLSRITAAPVSTTSQLDLL